MVVWSCSLGYTITTPMLDATPIVPQRPKKTSRAPSSGSPASDSPAPPAIPGRPKKKSPENAVAESSTVVAEPALDRESGAIEQPKTEIGDLAAPHSVAHDVLHDIAAAEPDALREVDHDSANSAPQMPLPNVPDSEHAAAELSGPSIPRRPAKKEQVPVIPERPKREKTATPKAERETVPEERDTVSEERETVPEERETVPAERDTVPEVEREDVEGSEEAQEVKVPEAVPDVEEKDATPEIEPKVPEAVDPVVAVEEPLQLDPEGQNVVAEPPVKDEDAVVLALDEYVDEVDATDGAEEEEQHEPLGPHIADTIAQRETSATAQESVATEATEAKPAKLPETGDIESSTVEEPTVVAAEKPSTEVPSQAEPIGAPVIPARPRGPVVPQRPKLKLAEPKPETVEPKSETVEPKSEAAEPKVETLEPKAETVLETEDTAKKAPPPKPKKLSSKIAAFQQMFNQPAQEQPKVDREPRSGRLLEDRAGFAANLQNMMGGIALPGMASPELLKKLAPASSTDAEKSEPSTRAPRRARGPRGKKLPTSITETKVTVEPRFKLTVSELWEVSFKKKEEPARLAEDFDDNDLEPDYEVVNTEHTDEPTVKGQSEPVTEAREAEVAHETDTALEEPVDQVEEPVDQEEELAGEDKENEPFHEVVPEKFDEEADIIDDFDDAQGDALEAENDAFVDVPNPSTTEKVSKDEPAAAPAVAEHSFAISAGEVQTSHAEAESEVGIAETPTEEEYTEIPGSMGASTIMGVADKEE